MTERDGISKSVWQATVDMPLPSPANTVGPDYDVIIAGGGITGLSTALRLQEEGLKCLLLEAHTIGFGTSSGTSAHLNTLLDTPYTDIISDFGSDNARHIAEGAAAAIRLVAQNVRTYHIDCDFALKDGYLYAENPREEEELESMFRALTEVGVEAQYTDQLPLPATARKVLRISGQAQFHPLRYLLGLAAAFMSGGGVIREGVLVEKHEKDKDAIIVHSGTETFRCRHLIYATHIPPGVNILHFRCAPYRSYVMAALPESDDALPDALVYDMQDPYHYYRTAVIDGQRMLIAGGHDHKTGHHDHTEQVFAELEAYVRNLVPLKEVLYRWSAQYYEPADGLPYIGRMPGAGMQVYAATGFSGNGLTFGTLSALILSDLILDRANPLIDVLAPARIKPIAGFTSFVKENADVLKHFVADRIRPDRMELFAELAKTEGRVVKYKEHTIAVYKEADGTLKMLHPVCPHAGCIVQWNSAEKSWDCPCHGARYDVDGRVLNGPSVSGLRRIDPEI